MTSQTHRQVLKLIRDLSDDEAREVLGHLKARLQFTNGHEAAPRGPQADDWLLDGIRTVLVSRGHLATTWKPSRELIRRAAPNYEVDSSLTRATLAQHLVDPHPVVLKALGRVAASTLADWLCVPVSLRTMLTNVSHVPEAFDAAFPGYLAAGLVHLILPKDKRCHGDHRSPFKRAC